MKKATMQVGVGGEAEVMERFVDTWKRAERGEEVEPEIRLTYTDLETMVRVLTPKRLELLRGLRQGGAMSVRALSKRLGRDYKNVHTDVADLEKEGLISRTEDGLVEMLWDEIDARYRLVA